MEFKDRIGNDSGANRLEDALEWGLRERHPLPRLQCGHRPQ